MQNAFSVISVATKSICVTNLYQLKSSPSIYWKIKCICVGFRVCGCKIDWFCCDSNSNWKYLL